MSTSTIGHQSAASLPVSTDAVAQARLKALPQPAQLKFEHLRRVEFRTKAMNDGFYEEANRIREVLGNAQRDLGRFDRLHQPEAAFTYEEDKKTGRRTRVPADFPARAAIVARIDAAKAELRRIQDEQAAIRPGFIMDSINDWLIDQSPSKKFVDARVTPKLAKGETLAAAIDRNRDAQSRVSDDLARIRSAPRTGNEAKALMRAQVAAFAELGRPGVETLFHGGGEIRWPTEQFSAACHGAHPSVLVATVRNASALATWAARDAIIAALDAEIDRVANDRDALTADDQAARLAEGERTMLTLQREGEALLEMLERDGLMVHRACADPRVLLGIA